MTFIRKIANWFKASGNLIDRYYKPYKKDGVEECLNRGNSMYGSLEKWVKSPSIGKTSEKICINNALVGNNETEKGGIIVFSYEPKEAQFTSVAIADWLKKKMIDIKNHYSGDKRLVDAFAQGKELVEWTIGRYLSGNTYTSGHGEVFNENSLSLEVIGIELDTLVKMAEEISCTFGQKSVLVKDYQTGTIYHYVWNRV